MEFRNCKQAQFNRFELIFRTPDNTALLFCVSEMSEFDWD